jgi:hypothetical protein
VGNIKGGKKRASGRRERFKGLGAQNKRLSHIIAGDNHAVVFAASTQFFHPAKRSGVWWVVGWVGSARHYRARSFPAAAHEFLMQFFRAEMACEL